MGRCLHVDAHRTNAASTVTGTDSATSTAVLLLLLLRLLNYSLNRDVVYRTLDVLFYTYRNFGTSAKRSLQWWYDDNDAIWPKTRHAQRGYRQNWRSRKTSGTINDFPAGPSPGVPGYHSLLYNSSAGLKLGITKVSIVPNSFTGLSANVYARPNRTLTWWLVQAEQSSVQFLFMCVVS